LKALQERINQATEELRANEESLTAEMSAREECEQRMEQSNQEILENEKGIEQIERKVEQLNEEKRLLERKQKDLQNHIEQMDKLIKELEKTIGEKGSGVARLQGQAQASHQTIQGLERKLNELVESI
jgi:chromosome segregation ATPase